MKKLLAVLLVLLLVFSLAACGKKDDDGGKKDDKKSESSDDGKKDDGKKDDGRKDDGGVVGGAVKAVTGDPRELREGVQARDSWHAVSCYRVFEFDADGNCTRNEDVYVLGDPADKDDADSRMKAANWEPIWSADGKSFGLANSTKYTDLDDAYTYFDTRYYPYTIEYASGSKHVDEPSEEQKLADMKESFGFNFNDVKAFLGEYAVLTWWKDTVSVRLSGEATLDRMNRLAGLAYEACKMLGEDGKVYDYLGKYGDEITSAPVSDSEFNSNEFIYIKNGKEVKVTVGIDQKGDKSVTFAVGVMK